MKKIAMPRELRNCPSCGEKDVLSYYRENNYQTDGYWCIQCFKVALWDGIKVIKTEEEAYPNREKKQHDEEQRTAEYNAIHEGENDF